MELGLKGKTALITGGSRGIGYAVARQFGLEGVEVAIVARGKQSLEDAENRLMSETGGRVISVVADTGRDTEVNAMVSKVVKEFGGIDILVNCAAKPLGQGSVPTLSEITDDHFWEDMNVKVMGYLRCARGVAPHMKTRGWGRIINVSGLAARNAVSTIGSMRNVAVVAMTKNLAEELGSCGINVTAVHPGRTWTEATPKVVAARARGQGISEKEVLQNMAKDNPLNRIIDADEIAYVVTFLASPKSVAINGDVISAGGGAGKSIHY